MTAGRLLGFALLVTLLAAFASADACVEETQTCWSTVQEAVDNATAGQTVVITDNATYNENITVDKTLTLTSNGTGLPTIHSTNRSTIKSGAGINLTLHHLNISNSGSVSGEAMIESWRVTITDSTLWMDSSASTGIRNGGDWLRVDRVNITGVNTSTGFIDAATYSEVVVNNSRYVGRNGLVVSSGTPFSVYNTFINSTSGAAISGAGSNVVVVNVTAVGSVGGSFQDNAWIQDSYFYSNHTNNAAIAVRHNATIINTTVWSDTRGVWAYNSRNVTIIDSVVEYSGWDVGLAIAAASETFDHTIINSSTFTPDNTDFPLSAYAGNVTFINHVDVYVNDTNGDPLNDTSVTVRNASGAQVASENTAVDGRAPQMTLTYATTRFNGTAESTAWHTNHTVTASLSGYIPSSTSVNLSSSQSLDLTLNEEVLNVTSVMLNATDHPLNLTTANLTPSVVATKYDTLIYDWLLDGTSIAVLNLPFDTNISTTAAGAVRDYSTYQNNATLGDGNTSRTPTWIASGVSGGAYNFSGSDDLITIPDDSSFDPEELTFTGWFRASSFDAWNTVLSKWQSWVVQTEYSQLTLYYYDGSWIGHTSNYTLSTDTWYFFAVTYSNSTNTVRVWINDQLTYENTSLTTEAPVTSDEVAVGFNPTVGEQWNGEIDEIRVFDRILSEEQILALYGAGTPQNDLLVSQETVKNDVWRVAVTANNVTHDSSTMLSNALTTRSNSVCVQETGVCWPTVQEAVANATAGQTVVITDDATYEESVTISSAIRLTSNGSGLPTILGVNASAVTGSGFSVERVNLSITGGNSSAGAVFGSDINVSDAVIWADLTSSGRYAVRLTSGTMRLDGVNATLTTASGDVPLDFAGTAIINNSNFVGSVQSDLIIFRGVVTMENSEVFTSSGAGLYLYPTGYPMTFRNVTVNATSYAIAGGVTDALIVDSYITSASSASSVSINDNLTILRSTITNTGGGNTLLSWAQTNMTLIQDSDITGTLFIDASGDGSYVEIDIVNSTLDPSDVNFQNRNWAAGSAVRFMSYLDVQVNDSTAAFNGASVQVRDVSDALVETLVTGANGRIATTAIAYASENATTAGETTTWLTNHTVTADADEYRPDSVSVNMSMNQVLNFTLEPWCGSITTDATLEEDLTVSGTCFNIIADDVTLDCSGHTLTGDGTSERAGAILQSVSNVTVENCNLTGFDYGIFFNYSNQSVGQNLRVLADIPIHFYFSDFNNISNSHLEIYQSSSWNDRIFTFDNSDNNTIENVTAWGGGRSGFQVWGSDGNLMVNVSFNVSSANPYFVHDGGIDFLNSTVGGLPAYVYELGSRLADRVCPQTVENITAGWIYLRDCDDAVIQNVTLNSTGGMDFWPLTLSSTDNLTVQDSYSGGDEPLRYFIHSYGVTNSRFYRLYPGSVAYFLAADDILVENGSYSRFSLRGNRQTLRGLNITDTLYNLYGASAVDDLLVEDTRLFGPPFAALNNFDAVLFRNVTFDPDLLTTHASSPGSLTAEWYLRTIVRGGGVPIENATVEVRNVTAGEISYDVLTDSAGSSGFLLLRSFNYTFSDGTYTINNHSMVAGAQGFKSTTQQLYNITNNVLLTLDLSLLFNCNIIASSTCGGDTRYLGLEGPSESATNAHAQVYTNASYAHSLCCSTPLNSSSLNHDCSENTFLRLSSASNAHVQRPSVNTYPVQACMGLDNNTLSCAYRNNSCLANETCVLSQSADSNAHIGACGDYTLNLCCGVENDPPSIPTLILPAANASLTSRYVTFTWSSFDPQEDPITYYLNISAPSSCAALPVRTLQTPTYTTVEELCLDDYYNWSVQACDPYECSNWSETRNFTVASALNITLTTSGVDFGTLQVSTNVSTSANDTYDDSPPPLVVHNSGNVDASIDVRASTALWTNEPLGSAGYFTFDWQNDGSAPIDFTSSYQALTALLDWGASGEIGIAVQVPILEPAGDKSSTIQVMGTDLP